MRAVGTWTVANLDLSAHIGAHPRIGVLDVVPWVDLDAPAEPWTEASLAARDRFGRWAAAELGLPCFFYGPERTLPELRRRAWRDLGPDVGPDRPHPTAGACAVGARGVLVAYNLWIRAGVDEAVRVAAAIRGPALRTLGLETGRGAQVSCNLVTPHVLGPADAYDLVAAQTEVARAELVGLLPADVLAATPADRWQQLDVGPDRTIEARLAAHRSRPRRG